VRTRHSCHRSGSVSRERFSQAKSACLV